MFADVTLSCEDNKQNEAHGIMMSITSESSSEKINIQTHSSMKRILSK